MSAEFALFASKYAVGTSCFTPVPQIFFLTPEGQPPPASSQVGKAVHQRLLRALDGRATLPCVSGGNRYLHRLAPTSNQDLETRFGEGILRDLDP